MMTKTPKCESITVLQGEVMIEEKSAVSMEKPLQKMFDEMLVFISKTDFD